MSSSVLAGLTLLVLGESHMSLENHLTEPLNAALVAKGASVHSIGACGASAGDWLVAKKLDCGAELKGTGKLLIKGREASTTPIKQLIAQEKPDVVVLIIGDTMASYDKPAFPKAWAWQNVTGLTKAIGETGTPCVWVGPAWGKEGGMYKKNDARTQLMSNFLAANVAPCSYIDSLTLSKPGQWVTTDGQHFTVAGYKAWGAAIAEAMSKLPAESLGAKR
ncbi:cell division protein FtsQ [Pseudomonas daroniae]|uniref:Cell division protein FtsQ n=2 Tax=Phytopseudomonas TaxID=3236657 RepID=A0A4V6MXA7_9GAMM|nr:MULTISPECIES: SGNH/GDSL hydrolase family protein [Pseudomonas]TBU72070.1 cell division protein FtsQ [Pseudomonas daroniae]TBU76920.1 cell division protein FtsQ [Pseudomonas daroniae]TBU78135.1 cell division protein FtsQ [Pseudomonas sp. FRB 228]TBU87951.1 cell division protein FtsQ [Pseudomonas daroniae]TBU95622.1 cell division protein FtsQ [Pseudomonas dryadis]